MNQTFLFFIFLIPITMATNPSAPNILVVLLDDVDDIPETRKYGLPNVTAYFDKHGTTFENAFVTTPICCPSRASILTGRYQHNHLTIDNTIKNGCDGPNWDVNVAPFSVGKRLQDLGYRTGLFGKYSNNYKGDKVPEGWDEWLGLLGNSVYYNYSLSVNNKTVHHGDDPTTDYLPDVIFKAADTFITNTTENRPWFAFLSFPTAHEPFDAAPAHQSTYEGARPPSEKLPTYNRTGCPTKHWYTKSRPPLTELSQKYNRLGYRRRLQSLLTVDTGFMQLLTKLNTTTTTIIFTSDNGFYFGEWGMILDKRQPYEMTIRVPMMVSGPLFTTGQRTPQPALNIDIAPTVVDIAHRLYTKRNGLPFPGAGGDTTMDGISMAKLVESPQLLRSSFLVEYHGMGNTKDRDECSRANMRCWYKDSGVWQTEPKFDVGDEKFCFCVDSKNNTFTCLRKVNGASKNVGVSAEFNDFIACEFPDTGFHELYDLQRDIFQTNNIWNTISESCRSNLTDTITQMVACKGFEKCNEVSSVEFSGVCRSVEVF